MTSEDWTCPVCGSVMVRISAKYMTCLTGDTRLYNMWSVDDLPEAYYFVSISKKVMIKGFAGTFRQVPGIKKEALERCPPQGYVVAKIIKNGRFKVRLFKPL